MSTDVPPVTISVEAADALATALDAAVAAARETRSLVAGVRTAPRRGALRRAADRADLAASVAERAVQDARDQQLRDAAREAGVEL